VGPFGIAAGALPPEVFEAAASATRPIYVDLDFFAARGEAQTPLRFSSGHGRGTTLPFALATGGRGTLSTTLGPRR